MTIVEKKISTIAGFYAIISPFFMNKPPLKLFFCKFMFLFSICSFISFYMSVLASIKGTYDHDGLSTVSLIILIASYYPLKYIQSKVYYRVFQELEVTQWQLIWISFILAQIDFEFDNIFLIYNVSHKELYCNRCGYLCALTAFIIMYCCLAGTLSMVTALFSLNHPGVVSQIFFFFGFWGSIFLILQGFKEAWSFFTAVCCANSCCCREEVHTNEERVKLAIEFSRSYNQKGDKETLRYPNPVNTLSDPKMELFIPAHV